LINWTYLSQEVDLGRRIIISYYQMIMERTQALTRLIARFPDTI
jgi:hypothetical protein